LCPSLKNYNRGSVCVKFSNYLYTEMAGDGTAT